MPVSDGESNKKSILVNGYRISFRNGKWIIVKNGKVVHESPTKNAAYVWAYDN